MKKAIKAFLILVIVLIVVLLTTIQPVQASEYGNEWVYDESQVLTEDTENYIKNLNENVFSTYKNKPQLAIIIIDELPSNINTYKLDMFNEYGVGTKEENCGMLFVFAIEDREYGLEIGDGFVEGSYLRNDLETDFINEDIKSDLRSENYDSAILKVVKHLESIMANEENGVYAQKEANRIVENQAAANEVIALIDEIGNVEYTSECKDAIKSARSKYFWLTSEQKSLVTNYNILLEANDKYDKLEQDATIAVLKKIGIGICIICPIIALIVLAVNLIRRYIHKKRIIALCEQHYKYLSLAEIDENSFIEYFEEHCTDKLETDCEWLEEKFFDLLYNCYLDNQMNLLSKSIVREENRELYIRRFKEWNTIGSFKECHLLSVEAIIQTIDNEEDEKARVEKKNIEIIEQFFKDNKHRILNPEIISKVKERLDRLSGYRHVVNNAQLESVFSDSLNELSFDWEFNKFCEENKNNIDVTDFNRDEFYRNIKSSDNYYNYHATRRYDRSWMLPLLMIHMTQQKEQRLERERREEERRRRAEQRRREEAARRERERMNSYNSSFGSGFGGGSSGGGGFSGGW